MDLKTRILVVDDNHNLCENIKVVLEQNNYLAECAFNGKDAIELARNNKYDIALVDIKLPDISGNEVVKKNNRDFSFNGFHLYDRQCYG